MVTSVKFTSADLDLMPDDGKRYEIIEGEVYASRQHSIHKSVSKEQAKRLDEYFRVSPAAFI